MTENAGQKSETARFNPEESARVQLRSAFLAELAALREGEAA
jgi:hypothetical protein